MDLVVPSSLAPVLLLEMENRARAGFVLARHHRSASSPPPPPHPPSDAAEALCIRRDANHLSLLEGDKRQTNCRPAPKGRQIQTTQRALVPDDDTHVLRNARNAHFPLVVCLSVASHGGLGAPRAYAWRAGGGRLRATGGHRAGGTHRRCRGEKSGHDGGIRRRGRW